MRSHHSSVKERVSICLETCTATGVLISFEYSSSLSIILAVALATYLWESKLAAYVERLIEPFWHRISSYPTALAPASPGLDPTSTHRLCTLPQNKRDAYRTPNVRVARTRAPPGILAPRQ